MKNIRILPLLLLAFSVLTACGTATMNQTGGYWSNWVKDVPNGEYEQAESETFTYENNGYSIALTLDRWQPTRGSNEYVLHPASDEIPLPLLKSSDCAIPFVLTAKTTTSDSTFTTDYYISASALAYNTEYDVYQTHDSYLSYTCSLSRFEATVEGLTEYFDGLKPSYDKEPFQAFVQD